MEATKQTEKQTKVKFPSDIETTLREIIEINKACAQIQMSSVLGGKLHYDLTKLSKDSESIVDMLLKSKKQVEEKVKKSKLGQREEAELLESEFNELLDKKEKIRIPLIKLSDLYATREYRAFEIREGDALVPPFFLKVMWNYIEHDKKF